MTAHLVFTLMAPLGAWGSASSSAANAAYKATELDPSRSAVIGILGAAMGWQRDRQALLDRALHLAIRVDVEPVRDPKPDYHTITKARPPSGRERWTRFEELRAHLAGRDRSGSILSWREYWTSGLWTVAVASAVAEAPPLAVLLQALERPRWPLYAGRKACVLGLPPDPAICRADSPMQAMAAYGRPWTRHPEIAAPLRKLVEQAGRCSPRLLYDLDYPGAPEPARTWPRRDRADHERIDGRLHWRHRERLVGEAGLPGDVHA